MKRLLLDTSAYCELLKGNPEVLDALANCETVFMSIFVLGELFAGFRGGSKGQLNREQLGSFLRKEPVRILDASSETAEVFGEIKDRLKRAGTPIPSNDVWIAAHAIETGAVLVTLDAHFQDVHGLRLWTKPKTG